MTANKGKMKGLDLYDKSIYQTIDLSGFFPARAPRLLERGKIKSAQKKPFHQNCENNDCNIGAT
jgi:hypothetical protein